MSDSRPLADSPDCETPETLPLRVLAEQVSDAHIHIGIYHPRTKAVAELTGLLRAITYHTLAFGDRNPEGWRPQVVEVLAAQYYKRGCCTWRG